MTEPIAATVSVMASSSKRQPPLCLADEEGQGVVEWSLILALVAVVAITILGTAGTSLGAFIVTHSLLAVAGAVALTAASAASYGLYRVSCHQLERRRARQLNREQLASWRQLLEPGVEGPFEHREGYEILVPTKRREVETDGTVSIDFIICLYRFTSGAWSLIDKDVTVDELAHVTKPQRSSFVDRLLGRDRRQSALPTISDFERLEKDLQLSWPATTPIETLAAQWFDFGERVRTQNRMAWAKQNDSKLEEEARKDDICSQLKVAELLPGPTTDGSNAAALLRDLEQARLAVPVHSRR